MNKRMWLVTVALVGFFVANYLALYKLGYIGALTCSIGSCEKVQVSRWATLLGMPVAVWGVGYYAAVLALGGAGLHEAFADSRSRSTLMLVLTGWGLAFSAWLTYLELFVINAICQWCVVSAVLAAVLFALAAADWRADRLSAPGSRLETDEQQLPRAD